MALDISKISSQGIGVLNANATIVSGSGPSVSYKVTVTATSVDSKWTTDGVVLDNVTSVSGESTFLITSKPGFQVSSSFFNYDPDPTETSTLISSITFTNTVNNFDPSNQVLVTITWITQSISANTDIALNNIQVEQPVAGNFDHALEVNIRHEQSVEANINLLYGFGQTTSSSIGLDQVNEINQLTQYNIQGMMQENETALIAIVNITPVDGGGAFDSTPTCEVDSGNSDNYILETSFEYNKQVVKIYYTPTLEDYEDSLDDSIIITSNNYNEPTFIVQDLNNNEVSNFTVQDPSSILEVKIIGVHAILGNWQVFTHPYDSSTLTGDWIPSSTITFDSNSAIMSLSINQNTGAQRQAVVNLYTTYDTSTPLKSFIVTQTEDHTLDLSIVQVDDYLGNSLSNSFDYQETSGSINLPVTGGVINLQAIIESYNNFPELASSVDFHIQRVEGDTNTDWLDESNANTTDNTFNLQYNINPNNIQANPLRSANITIKHPIDNSITKSIFVSQDRAYDPSIDTLTVYSVINPTTIVGDDGDTLYETGTNANTTNLAIEADMSSYINSNIIIQMDFGNTALLGDPVLQLRYITDDSGNNITNDISNDNNGFIEWAIISDLTSIDDSNINYNYYAVLNIESNLSMTDTRSVVVEIYHPNSLIEDLTSVSPAKSITIDQSVFRDAYFNYNVNNNHLISALNEIETFTYPILASGGTPLVILERTVYYDNNNTVVEEYNHAGTPAGESGESGHLVDGFNVTSNAAENSYNLNATILRNLIQEPADEPGVIRISQIFNIWQSGVVPGNYSLSDGNYSNNPNDRLIVDRVPLDPSLIDGSITPTGLMGSIATDSGLLNPIAYSMSGIYNYVTPNTATHSSLLFYNTNLAQDRVVVNLHNEHNLSNTLTYEQSYSNAIVVVIGLVNIPSYQTITIEPQATARLTYSLAGGSPLSGSTSVNEAHITNYSIVSDTSGSDWSTTGDFSKYIKFNIAPIAQFTQSGQNVHRIQHRFHIKTNGNNLLDLLLNTRTNY